MTDTKVRRNAAARARAAIKAQRWAIKKEHGKSKWPPMLAAGSAILGGVLVGGILSLTVGSGGLLDRAIEGDSLVVADATVNSSQSGRRIVPGVADSAVGLPSASKPVAAQGDRLLVPAAGPKHEPAGEPRGDGPVVYEEPFNMSDDAPRVSESLLESAIQEAALESIAVPQPPGYQPLWQKNAVATANLDGRPMIAIVIDDLGLNRINARRAIALRPPLTLAFMTYAPGLDAMTSAARTIGHELLVHVPMEPNDPSYDAGENALTTALDPEELARRLDWALSRFEGYVGINNHMGSKFTASPLGMAQVMAALRSRGLLFLDSRTSGSSVGVALAERMGVVHVGRDVFIDNEPDNPGLIRRQLAYLERIARRRGKAVGIGHPHDITLEVLAEWLVTVERRGFVLVPLSAIVRDRIETVENMGNAG